jgi:hypothetical protein
MGPALDLLVHRLDHLRVAMAEEKRAMAAVDEKARDLLARTETRAREQFGLHGTIRESRPTAEDSTHG